MAFANGKLLLGVTGASPFNVPARAAKRDLFLVSALFLFLELAFIRWFPAQVLFFTFFTNTVLLASFLGLSLGCLAARHRKSYLAVTPVLMAVSITSATGMEWVRLALQDILDVGSNKASPQMVYFGTEIRVTDVASFVVPIELIVGAFFVLIALTMVGIGQLLGRRFAALPNPVGAYMINIGGSLAGVLLFQLCSWWLSPVWWFAIVAAGLIYFLMRADHTSRIAIAFAAAIPLLLILPAKLDTGIIREKFPHEFWSPYYRINYSRESRTIVVNLLGHQNMVSRNDPFPAYSVPYMVNRDAGQPRFQDILIIGAGSGNDLSRALQWASPDARIDAVEIDPVIRKLGIHDHPDRPYDDPRVRAHLADGRNFLRSTDQKYDLIVFALIDSLVLHSSVSNIRLESYLFTNEAMNDVRRCLKPGGLFVMYNYFRQGWIISRLFKTLEHVFHEPPVVLTFPHTDAIKAGEKADGFTLFFAGDRAAAIRQAFESTPRYVMKAGVAPSPASDNGFRLQPSGSDITFRPATVEIPLELRLATDVWPFLYLRNPMIPNLTFRGVAVIGLLSLAMLWGFGWRLGQGHLTRPNFLMFFLGAGFMLVETKAVVHMALVFGSTWVVNTVVFSAILVMILAANLWVLKRTPTHLAPYYLGLMTTLALNVVIPLDSFLGLPQPYQGIAAGALVLSPVLFSGVIFAVLFASARKPEQALAYNTAGAILGGLAESFSLLIGFQYLLIVAALMYVASWALLAVQGPRSREVALEAVGGSG